MTNVNPYLSFNGNCFEAIHFYQQCLGGTLTLQKVSESPMADHVPAHMQDQVLHSTLTSGSLVIMASDMVRGGLVKGNSVGLNVNCSSEEEINRFYHSLAEGGEIMDELGVMFWGDTFGSLSDKYGVRWMFNYHKE